MQNSSDASSASSNPDTAHQVSCSDGLDKLRALCTIHGLEHYKEVALQSDVPRSILRVHGLLFVWLQLLEQAQLIGDLR